MTGASSGLGARFATVLAQAGAQVVACARRLERVEALARSQHGVAPVRCDVAETGRPRPARRVPQLERFGRDRRPRQQRRHRRRAGPSSRRPSTPSLTVMRVNVESVFALTQAVASPMREQGSGSRDQHQLDVRARRRRRPCPTPAYVASKSAPQRPHPRAREPVGIRRCARQRDRARVVLDRDERRAARGRAVAPLVAAPVPDGSARASSTSSTAFSSSSPPTPRRTAPGQVIAIDGGWTVR